MIHIRRYLVPKLYQLEILAAPFVVVLTLLALVLFIGGQTLGGMVFLVLVFLVSPFGLPAIGEWLLERLYGVKYALRDFMCS